MRFANLYCFSVGGRDVAKRANVYDRFHFGTRTILRAFFKDALHRLVKAMLVWKEGVQLSPRCALLCEHRSRMEAC